MPTVILLDVSLSMSRPVHTPDATENHTRHTLASIAINTFLDYLNIHAKLEYVALVAFSSLCEVAVPFTRDYDTIRQKLNHLEEGDKTCVEQALLAVNQLVLNEWGYQTPVQIILVTDGSCGVGAIGRNRVVQALPLPPSYPARIHVLPIASPHDSSLPHAMPLYQKIVDQASMSSNGSAAGSLSRGAIYCPDQLSVSGVAGAAARLCEQQFAEFACWLRCGRLAARVQLFPAPQPAAPALADAMHVVGFVSQQDLGTPISISKHLVIPQANNERRETFGAKASVKDGSTPESSGAEEDLLDPSKVPNFCVLLHGALKVEGMVAVVQLGERWWGTVGAWCEAAASRARRSCLLLSALRAGEQAAPWLGPLRHLGPADEPAGGDSDAPPAAESFPIRAVRSYSGGGGGAAWCRPHALLADVQKVLRHARKLPDKTQHFYKELNRLRRSAISLGFSELLASVAAALEREVGGAGGAGAEGAQLAHAAAALRDPRTALDAKHALQPLPNF